MSHDDPNNNNGCHVSHAIDNDASHAHAWPAFFCFFFWCFFFFCILIHWWGKRQQPQWQWCWPCQLCQQWPCQPCPCVAGFFLLFFFSSFFFLSFFFKINDNGGHAIDDINHAHAWLAPCLFFHLLLFSSSHPPFQPTCTYFHANAWLALLLFWILIIV